MCDVKIKLNSKLFRHLCLDLELFINILLFKFELYILDNLYSKGLYILTPI